MIRTGLLAATVLVLVAFVSQVAARELVVVLDFDPSLGELPEALTLDGDGNMFLSMVSGEIKKVTPAGEASTFGSVPSPGEGFVTGLTFGNGDLFVGLASFEAETHGIWRVAPDGSAQRFVALDPTTLPNGILSDGAGNLLVSDSFGGQILRISPAGEVEVWSADPLLAAESVDPLPFAVGPNGIAFDSEGRNLFVVTTGSGRVLRIPIGADGSASAAELVLEDRPLLAGADGIAFDSQGALYIAVITQDRLVLVSPEGQAQSLVEGDPLQNPSDVAFGVGDQADELFITNFSALRALGLQEGTPRPALLKLVAEEAPEGPQVGLPATGTGGASGGVGWPLLAGIVTLGAAALAGAAALRRGART